MTRRVRHTNVSEIGADAVEDLRVLSEVLGQLVEAKAIEKDGRVMEAFDRLATFTAITMRVLANTNPSKIKAAAVAVEIQQLIPPSDLAVPPMAPVGLQDDWDGKSVYMGRTNEKIAA